MPLHCWFDAGRDEAARIPLDAVAWPVYRRPVRGYEHNIGCRCMVSLDVYIYYMLLYYMFYMFFICYMLLSHIICYSIF